MVMVAVLTADGQNHNTGAGGVYNGWKTAIFTAGTLATCEGFGDQMRQGLDQSKRKQSLDAQEKRVLFELTQEIFENNGVL